MTLRHNETFKDILGVLDINSCRGFAIFVIGCLLYQHAIQERDAKSHELVYRLLFFCQLLNNTEVSFYSGQKILLMI